MLSCGKTDTCDTDFVQERERDGQGGGEWGDRKEEISEGREMVERKRMEVQREWNPK